MIDFEVLHRRFATSVAPMRFCTFQNENLCVIELHGKGCAYFIVETEKAVSLTVFHRCPKEKEHKVLSIEHCEFKLLPNQATDSNGKVRVRLMKKGTHFNTNQEQTSKVGQIGNERATSERSKRKCDN